MDLTRTEIALALFMGLCCGQTLIIYLMDYRHKRIVTKLREEQKAFAQSVDMAFHLLLEPMPPINKGATIGGNPHLHVIDGKKDYEH